MTKSTPSLLSNIRIVLVNSYHPGNIGAAARAMKTMGLSELYLVSPEKYPHPEASSRAAGAKNLLESAVVVATFEEAIADCTQVFATTARQEHSYSRPQSSAREVAKWIELHPQEKVAIVFGRERDGLSSDELGLCQHFLYIAGNPSYSVLNMGAAVQIVCYELFNNLFRFSDNEETDSRFSQSGSTATNPEPLLAKQKDLEYFYADLESRLERSGYIRPNQPTDTIKRLRALFDKAEMTAQEVAMLRGVVKSLSRIHENNGD
ncbi:RNA methyltransferase [Aliikangiella sp. G2MR2-5]|uniref:RNA methyltransferase n=1 Tax=Aliikangiella sp. G2MR2-5 TaxID=2788943 RepID=UPI0018AABCFD|nr:RNA methyltransferase [Aliikangiella sp. G2MR2-5]